MCALQSVKKADIVSLGTYTDKVVKSSDAKTAAELNKFIMTLDQRREDVLDAVAKQSAKKAQDIIMSQLRTDKDQVKKTTDPGALLDLLQKLKAKRIRLANEVGVLQASAPSFNELVAGEFHAVSQYTDKRAVVRMMDRLNEQLRGVMNSTAVEKRKSVLQVAHASARLYAHQVAHATHSKYLKFKLGRLNMRMDSVKKDISRLRNHQSPGDEDELVGPDKYDHLLDDDEQLKKTGSSVKHFTVQHDSWLNPDVVVTPVEVTPSMRFSMKSALQQQFNEIAGIKRKGGGDSGSDSDKRTNEGNGDSEVRDLGESDHI